VPRFIDLLTPAVLFSLAANRIAVQPMVTAGARLGDPGSDVGGSHRQATDRLGVTNLENPAQSFAAKPGSPWRQQGELGVAVIVAASAGSESKVAIADAALDEKQLELLEKAL
jgi:hypothetical protein